MQVPLHSGIIWGSICEFHHVMQLLETCLNLFILFIGNFTMLCKCHCTVGKYEGSICEFHHVVQSFRNMFELVPTCLQVISPCYASATSQWENSICEFHHVVQSFRNMFELVPTCSQVISPCYAKCQWILSRLHFLSQLQFSEISSSQSPP